MFLPLCLSVCSSAPQHFTVLLIWSSICFPSHYSFNSFTVVAQKQPLPKCCCFYCKSRARTVGGLAYIVSNLSSLQHCVVVCRGHTWELQNAIKKSQNIHLIMFSVPFLVVPGCIQHTSRRVNIRGWACLAGRTCIFSSACCFHHQDAQHWSHYPDTHYW